MFTRLDFGHVTLVFFSEIDTNTVRTLHCCLVDLRIKKHCMDLAERVTGAIYAVICLYAVMHMHDSVMYVLKIGFLQITLANIDGSG